MTSTTIFFDSKKGKGKSENFIINFDPPLELDIRRRYEIALISAEIWYSWRNITKANNRFVYSTTTTTKEIEIPPGAYNIEDLNDAIHHEMKKLGDLIEGKYPINITPNYNTLKTRLELKFGHSVTFDIDNSLRDILGFQSKIISGDGFHEGDDIVNITTINTAQIHCDLVNGSYINGTSSDLLYSVSPNVPAGYLIQVEPSQKIYVPTKRLSKIDSIRFTLKDQDNNYIDLNNERTTYYIHLREII